MNINLLHDRTGRINVLNLLQRYVFALRKLYDIFDAIDDFESADLIDEADIAGVDPAFFIDCLLRSLRIYSLRNGCISTGYGICGGGQWGGSLL